MMYSGNKEKGKCSSVTNLQDGDQTNHSLRHLFPWEMDILQSADQGRGTGGAHGSKASAARLSFLGNSSS